MFLLKYVIAQQVIVKTIKFIIMQPLVEYSVNIGNSVRYSIDRTYM